MLTTRAPVSAAALLTLVACGDGEDTSTALAPAMTTQAAAQSPRSSATPSAQARKETNATDSTPPVSARWYGGERVERGGPLFTEHCAGCHGATAAGAIGWRQRNSDGTLLPPPLNGTGHAWHHPLRVLGSQVKFGTPPGMGTMPGFGDRLTDEHILDTIAWFQDRWPNEIYQAWLERERRSRETNR